MAEALISVIPEMKRKTVDAFVNKAVELDHDLIEKKNSACFAGDDRAV